MKPNVCHLCQSSYMSDNQSHGLEEIKRPYPWDVLSQPEI